MSHHMDGPRCVYPSLVDGHLDSFQVFSVISKAIRKMNKKKIKRTYTFISLVEPPRS